ncbi:PepSY domain-containing protein [Paraglaciecola chathamensis]|uniref:PepSY domain-containing protein n=1 Tax=Paraglaciecola chathamensis TaxID=368405 RepID=UPI0027032E31|nr:PepSY domain-containing protein [Paraglaciecola chathamensis]MDO6839612.1 PepSY domain-containing protein [Paraglaciecola chathamensis]
MASAKFHNTFRQYHRWLGFFLAGIMAVYATSGILLIFRSTDLLKYEYTTVHELAAELSPQALQKELHLKGYKFQQENETEIRFNYGVYQKTTGQAEVTKQDYPLVLRKLVSLHKATTNSPLFVLNITFGVVLLFFVVSAFLMFMPKAKLFKNGLKIASAGFLFALLVVIFGS